MTAIRVSKYESATPGECLGTFSAAGARSDDGRAYPLVLLPLFYSVNISFKYFNLPLRVAI